MERRPSEWATDTDVEGILSDDIENWKTYAECGGTYDERFFPVGEKDDRQREVIAEFCTTCLVRSHCLRYALDHPDKTEFGTWGGKTQNELRETARRSRRLGA